MSVTDPTDVHSIGLAEHVEESVEVVAQFHQEHHQAATGLQRAIDRVTTTVGRPRFVIGLAIILGAWVTAAMVVSRGRIEQPAFTWLELAATLAALLVSLLILATQRREDQLAERRAQLILQFALLSDKKNAKIIALLEELRRDTPTVTNRVDVESEDMQKPADPLSVLAAIDKLDPKDESN